MPHRVDVLRDTGHDAEAAGNPPTKEELERARRAETKRPDAHRASRHRPNSAAEPD